MQRFCSTSSFVIGFLPVEDDERRTPFDRYHGEVGGRDSGGGRHVLIAAVLVVWEVSQGGRDGTRLVWLLVGLVDDVRRCGRVQSEQNIIV